jgi:hypothetical protein
MREELSAPHAKCQTKQTEDCNRHHAYFSRAQSNSHDQRNRNGRRNGEDAPRTLCESLYDDERENSQQNNHDRQNTDQSEQTDATPDFLSYHFPKRFPAAPD